MKNQLYVKISTAEFQIKVSRLCNDNYAYNC